MTNRLDYVRGTLAAPSPDGELVFTASAEGVNRYGYSLNRKRWKIDNFNANPVILWMHNDRLPPIGRGRAVIDQAGLKVSVTFDRSDPFAMEIERKYRAGFMNAVSVGFDFVNNEGKPMDWWSMSMEDLAAESWYDLAEVSTVPVPADPNALIRQRAALAADFGLWTPEDVGRMTVIDLGSRSRTMTSTTGTMTVEDQGYPVPPAPPVAPSPDLEQRLSKIEETLSRLAPPVVETEPTDAPADPGPVAEELDPDQVSGLLDSIAWKE